MSRIGLIFKKLTRTLNNSKAPTYPKLTPNEVELNAFKERERLDKVKQGLLKYRSKNSMLNQQHQDINIFKKQPQIITKDNSLLKNHKSTAKKILDAENLFW
jgi:hypothetical protein